MRKLVEIRPFPWWLAPALLLALGSSVAAEKKEGALERLLNAPAVEHPLVFAWGTAFGTVAANLKESKVLERRPDRELRFTRGQIEYHYSFFQRSGAGLRAPSATDGPARGGGSDESSPGILFAVTMLLPGIALNGEGGRELVALLEAGYGRTTNRTAAYFDLENASASVRVYLESYRRIPYVRRVTFVSKRLALERNRQYQGAVRLGEATVGRPEGPLWDFSRRGAASGRSQPVASVSEGDGARAGANGR